MAREGLAAIIQRDLGYTVCGIAPDERATRELTVGGRTKKRKSGFGDEEIKNILRGRWLRIFEEWLSDKVLPARKGNAVSD